MRKKIIAGNWKMNKDIHETETLVSELKPRLAGLAADVDVVLCPPFPSLLSTRKLIAGTNLKLGAQNVSQFDDGAYTGEVSGGMLTAAGCEFVILGHSERRHYFGETNELINLKVKKALQHGLRTIICVGESLQEREAGITDQVITRQVEGVLKGLSATNMEKVVMAYEPIWAIGTGKNATSDQADQVHKLIRRLVTDKYSVDISGILPILYGGSVNAGNALDLLSQQDVDGALVGGASLKVDSFQPIVEAASKLGGRKLT